MPIETAFQYIDDLNSAYPDGSDNVSKGDDHIRGIKSVLLTTFPNFTGAVTATAAHLNFCNTLTENVQDAIDDFDTRLTGLEGALSAPSGLKILIRSATVPTGWTQDTTYNDCMLRVISGTTPSQFTTGDSPILMNKVPSHTHGSSAMTAASNGAHTHDAYSGYNAHNNCAGSAFAFASQPCGAKSGVVISNGAHTHSISGSTDANSSAANWTPKYVDLLLITKS